MRRRISAVGTVASLCLGLALLAVWVRSHWFWDEIAYQTRTRAVAFHSGVGRIELHWATAPSGWPGDPHWRWQAARFVTLPPGIRDSRDLSYGPAFQHHSHSMMGIELSITKLPHWFLVALTGVLPAGWLWRRWWAKPDGRQPCGKCGYDLRGSLGPTCPECGTPRTTNSAG